MTRVGSTSLSLYIKSLSLLFQISEVYIIDSLKTAALKLKDACPLEGKDKPRQLLKSRDITLPTKVRMFKAMVLPVVMYGCKSWTIKKAER